jgi:hypothetical protein
VFKLETSALVEMNGADQGTPYRAGECEDWGTDRQQLGDLILDVRKLPRKKDLVRTLANEWVVSQRLAETLSDAGVTGIQLRAVRHKARYEDDALVLDAVPSGRELLRQAESLGISRRDWAFTVWLSRWDQRDLLDRAIEEQAEKKKARARANPKPLPAWYQLIVTSRPVPMAPPTRFGIHPFDEDEAGEYRSEECDVAGLNVLTEVYVPRGEWHGQDFGVTRQFVGARGGLVLPGRLLLVSPRVRRLFVENDVTGASFEVAHLVS